MTTSITSNGSISPNVSSGSASRSKDYDEIKPLIELCKAGRLREIQAWIDAGKPINMPEHKKGTRRKSPLQYAIEKGFYSLVEILLESGAIIHDGAPIALKAAVVNRRLDLIELLVEHGADLKTLDMFTVFESWQPEIIDYFIEAGVDVETGNPLAEALIEGIKPALGVYKRFHKRISSFQEQLNIALRYHCAEGSLKWASLLKWAGADPFSKGPRYFYEKPDPEVDHCALELAAFYRHNDIFTLKGFELTPDIPVAGDMLRIAIWNDSDYFLKELLNLGFDPLKLDDQGSELISTCIQMIDWYSDDYLHRSKKYKLKDTYVSREKLSMIRILVKYGVKWIPKDRYEINRARRVFLQMKEDYAVEFAEIMVKSKGCSKETLAELFGATTIRKHLHSNMQTIEKLIHRFD